MARFFDSHIHLHTESISGWEDDKDWVFNNVSITLEDFYKCLNQSLNNEHVFITAGIHPLELDGIDIEKEVDILDNEIKRNRKRIIAIGETGFDFYRTTKEKSFEKQKRSFLLHYELAKKHNLPLMLHIRNAHEEALEVLRGFSGISGVIHSFDGDLNIANRYLSLSGNWMLSISPLLFRKTSEVNKCIRELDIKRLLVETDAPFLSESYYEIKDIIIEISKQKKMEFEACKEILWNNFCRFFKFKVIQ